MVVDDGCSAQFELDKLPKDMMKYYQYNFAGMLKQFKDCLNLTVS